MWLRLTTVNGDPVLVNTDAIASINPVRNGNLNANISWIDRNHGPGLPVQQTLDEIAQALTNRPLKEMLP